MNVRNLAILFACVLLGPIASVPAQFIDVVIDPALGPRPTFGPGGFVGNGFGYRSYGPGGFGGYYTGLYLPPNDLGNGPSPYYSPIFNAMAAAPSPNAPTGRAGWSLKPSLPFTGRRNYRLFQRH